jgi:deoxyribodipyrimidine photolyase-related protein
MKYYEDYLIRNQIKVRYINAREKECDTRVLIASLAQKNPAGIRFYDVVDDWLERRILESCKTRNIKCREIPSPLFLSTKEDLKAYFEDRHKYFHNDFYIRQRKRLNILTDHQQKPLGGKWSFDADNRRKYPKGKTPPGIVFPEVNHFYREAISYVERHYSDHYGIISSSFIYPTTHQQSETWLKQFLETRFSEFGKYEDAIVGQANILNHSVLSPLLNTGLLLPGQVVDAALRYAEDNNVPLNSLEGFIRQIIGWREFIRGIYLYSGKKERSHNFWSFKKSMPSAFYDATTGLAPLDGIIHKVLHTAYAHHIERLMVLGNFMVLCEIHPDAVYRWFMEMFIDAYDWVMVPNVYGMSQFADGGLMATKPYISGSNYLMKMSDFGKGAWQTTWDALFWRFLHVHRNFFSQNPRLNMLVRTFDKMTAEKQATHLQAAENFMAAI